MYESAIEKLEQTVNYSSYNFIIKSNVSDGYKDGEICVFFKKILSSLGFDVVFCCTNWYRRLGASAIINKVLDDRKACTIKHVAFYIRVLQRTAAFIANKSVVPVAST